LEWFFVKNYKTLIGALAFVLGGFGDFLKSRHGGDFLFLGVKS
jgi:hypothetical protein